MQNLSYNADGQQDGPFGIYTNGRKNPGEVDWTNGEREPGVENRAPIAQTDKVPREITFIAQSVAFGFTGWTPEGGYSRIYESLNLSINLFFWDPDGDTLDLEYFVSSLPSGIFHTTSDGKVPSALLELDERTTPGTAGYAWLKACDPEGLCAWVDFYVFAQPDVTPKDPGEFTVKALYCKLHKSEQAPDPFLEVEICARDLEYEDGDFLYMTIRALRNNYRGPHTLFFPLGNSPTCRTVMLRGSKVDGGSVTYDFALNAQSMRGGLLYWPWWNWNTDQPLCEVGQTPDCFVGPMLYRHPGIEENRGELTVRTSIDSETHDWRYTPVTPTVTYEKPIFNPDGQITLITQETCTATTLDDQAEIEEARRKAEEAQRLAEEAGEGDGTSTTDTTTVTPSDTENRVPATIISLWKAPEYNVYTHEIYRCSEIYYAPQTQGGRGWEANIASGRLCDSEDYCDEYHAGHICPGGHVGHCHYEHDGSKHYSYPHNDSLDFDRQRRNCEEVNGGVWHDSSQQSIRKHQKRPVTT